MSDIFIDEKEEDGRKEVDGVEWKRTLKWTLWETEEKQSIARAGLL